MHSMTLQTNDATITANDVLGRIAFASPNESGAEAVKVVGKFEVQAEEAFDASNNATKMVFYLAADGDAATRMTLSSAGTATLGGNLIIADASIIHQSYRKNNAGIRVSLDTGFDMKMPDLESFAKTDIDNIDVKKLRYQETITNSEFLNVGRKTYFHFPDKMSKKAEKIFSEKGLPLYT